MPSDLNRSPGTLAAALLLLLRAGVEVDVDEGVRAGVDEVLREGVAGVVEVLRAGVAGVDDVPRAGVAGVLCAPATACDDEAGAGGEHEGESDERGTVRMST